MCDPRLHRDRGDRPQVMSPAAVPADLQVGLAALGYVGTLKDSGIRQHRKENMQ